MMLAASLRCKWISWFLIVGHLLSVGMAEAYTPAESIQRLQDQIRAGALLKVGDQVELTTRQGDVRDVRIIGLDQHFITIYEKGEKIAIEDVVAVRDLNQDGYKVWTTVGATAGAAAATVAVVTIALIVVFVSNFRLW